MSAPHVSAISFDPATSKYTVTVNRGNGKSIETTVTDKASVADEWVQDIINKYNNVTDQASRSVVDDNSLVVDDNSWVKLVAVGLDVKCSRHENVNPATLQLCIDDKCLILQLLYMDQFPSSLNSFLMDSKFAFVGVDVENNISMLIDRYGLKVRNRVDVTQETMCFQEVAVMLQSRPVSGWMSDWEARILSLDQVQFACLDSYVSYLLCASI
ncbi:hypothetical protein K1719_020087 [Acacia pycnantha]|nr:hypothetical protein K1719_020087 [Acacia pycnantha]